MAGEYNLKEKCCSVVLIFFEFRSVYIIPVRIKLRNLLKQVYGNREIKSNMQNIKVNCLEFF